MANLDVPRWKRAFPDFTGMPAELPAGFNDASWRTDAMPRFVNADAGLCLWIDYADPKARETAETPRFSLTEVDADGEDVDGTLCETESWAEVTRAIDDFRAPSMRP